MEHTVIHLTARALETALLLAVPVVAAVAAIGIATGVLQTVVQVQDQNVSFLPKLLVVAFLAAVAGAPALALLVALFKVAAIGAVRLLGR